MMSTQRCYRILSLCVICALCLALLPGQVQGAKLIAIIIADTECFPGGESFELDHGNMIRLAKQIAQNTGVRLELKTYSGHELTKSDVLYALRTLSVDSDDMILFHSASHGRNGGDAWPELIFTRGSFSARQWEYLHFSHIIETLKGYAPRLFIALADSCNHHIEEDSRRSIIKTNPPDKSLLAGYQHLFLNHHGTILACGAVRGNFSFSTDHNGGLFTQHFLQQLLKQLESPTPSWEKIQSRVLSYASISGRIYQQYPYYEMDVQFKEKPEMQTEEISILDIASFVFRILF